MDLINNDKGNTDLAIGIEYNKFISIQHNTQYKDYSHDSQDIRTFDGRNDNYDMNSKMDQMIHQGTYIKPGFTINNADKNKTTRNYMIHKKQTMIEEIDDIKNTWNTSRNKCDKLLHQIIKYIKKYRHIAEPNHYFISQLEQYITL